MTHRMLHQALALSGSFIAAVVLTTIALVLTALVFARWKRAAATTRYLVLSLALLIPLAAAALAVTSLRDLLPAPVSPVVTVSTAAPVVALPPSRAHSSEMRCVLFLIWVAAASASLFLSFRQWRRWSRVAQRSIPLRDSRIPAGARVSTSPAVTEPMVVGILSPSILVPETYLDALDDGELASVFAHENEHIRRRDNLTAVLHEIAVALFWFDPLHWIARRRLLELRERACDERVLEVGCSPDLYVSALAKSAHVAIESAAVACMSGFHIRERIESIMSYDVRRFHLLPVKTMRVATIVAALIAVGVFAMMAPQPMLAGAGASSSWSLSVEAREQSKGSYIELLITVRGPDGRPVEAKVTTPPTVPVSVTSKDASEKYTYQIHVTPPRLGQAGEAKLRVNEGSEIIYTSRIPVVLTIDERTSSAEKMSLDLKDAPIRDVMSVLERLLGQKVVVDPSVEGTITISAYGVPWDIAVMDAIRPLGLTMEHRGEAIFIVPASEPGVGRYIRLSPDITPPKLLNRVNPIYTQQAKVERTGGIVIIEALIDEAGTVQETRILQNLPHGLGESAETALKQWKFAPALKDGQPVAVVFNVTLNFRPTE